MGRIAKLLSFVRVTRNGAKISDVKINPGGNANTTAEHYSNIGEDAFPLNTDYVVDIDIKRSGGSVVVGYLDPINIPKALQGDKRIYSRQTNDGTSIAEVWLKNDGVIVVSNANGTITMETNGDVKINGGKIAIGNGSAELLDLIEQILIAIEDIKTNTSIGPQPIINVPAFVAIRTLLGTIKGTL